MAQQQNLSHLLNRFMEKTAQTCFVERRDIWTSLPVTHTSLAYTLPSSSGCENIGSGGMQEKQVSLADFSLPNKGTLSHVIPKYHYQVFLPRCTTCLSLAPGWENGPKGQQATKAEVGTSFPGSVHLSLSEFLLAS